MSDPDVNPEAQTPEQAAGLLPMSLHVSGAPHRGTHVRLVRCAPKGEEADLWMVLAGDRMLMETGTKLPAMAWHTIQPQLQRSLGMPFDVAHKLAKKVCFPTSRG